MLSHDEEQSPEDHVPGLEDLPVDMQHVNTPEPHFSPAGLAQSSGDQSGQHPLPEMLQDGEYLQQIHASTELSPFASLPSSPEPPSAPISSPPPVVPQSGIHLPGALALAAPTPAPQATAHSIALPPNTGPHRYLRPHHERPPDNVQWPMNIEISMIEICTFCPDWLLNPEVIARAIRNGWNREAIAKAQLYATDELTHDNWLRQNGRIQKQISFGGKLFDNVSIASINDGGRRFDSEYFRNRHGQQLDLTANAWRLKDTYQNARVASESIGHMPLSALYNRVINWPSGEDRMLMTQCLEFARNNQQLNLDTSHWDWIIQSQNFAAPAAMRTGVNRDDEALRRLHENVDDPGPRR